MTESTPRARVPELDGLRGLAILSVLVFHYVSQEGSAPAGTFAAAVQRFAILGWSGVDLFFVLSGFLIGGILMDARESPSYFRTFYLRRFFRIIPIYYLWIAAYIALVGFAGARVQALSNSGIAPPLGFSAYAHFLFLQNVGITVGFLGIAGAWFGHLWSLAVEEQFYLLAPVVVRWTRSARLPILLAGVILAAPVLRIALLGFAGTSVRPLVTVLTPCRADALATGMLAATLWRNARSRSWMEQNVAAIYGCLLVLAAGVLCLWIWAPQSSLPAMQTAGFTWLALFYVTLLLVALLRTSGPVAKLMRIAWLRELGTVSYCVYIIHLVVNVGLHAVILHTSPKISTAKGAMVTILAAFATYGCAKLSWILLEHPLLRRGHAFKY